VASSVVDELIKRPELLALGGEERVLSVMFSDVADFSTISEKLTPTELVSLLNEYLTAMTDIVIRHGGIIDKYQGDCIMAEFGAPLPYEDHALRSCRAALEMIDELGKLRKKWEGEGKPQLHARVGINTGRMLVGNLGSSHFVDYTVMGDHVNLASRLEGANKPYGTKLMVSEWTWEVVKEEMYGRELDRIRVKGKDAPVKVYEVMGRREGGAGGTVPPAAAELIAGFDAALELYKQARFADALAAFRALGERFPDDGPTALYAERCEEYLAEPPEAGWDGVYTMKTK
jgi:adenylate cyclase